MPPTRHPYIECPHCGEHLEKVYYDCDTYGKEWGTAYIGDEALSDHEASDGETTDTDNYKYKCPECNGAIREEYITNHITVGEEAPQEQEIKGIEPIDAGSNDINDPEHQEIPAWTSPTSPTAISKKAYEKAPAIECPKCGNEFMTGNPDDITEEIYQCTNPSCNHEFTIDEAMNKHNIIK